MSYEQLNSALQDFMSQPSPSGLVSVCENLLASLFSARITLSEAWKIQENLEYTGMSPEIYCNIIDVAHTAWEILESYAELSQDFEEYSLDTLQNSVSELDRILFRLKTSGWEPVYSYIRAYYECHRDGKVVASIAMTAYLQDGKPRAVVGKTKPHYVFKRIVSKAKDIDDVERALPTKIDEWELRNVVRAHALVSELQELDQA